MNLGLLAVSKMRLFGMNTGQFHCLPILVSETLIVFVLYCHLVIKLNSCQMKVNIFS